MINLDVTINETGYKAWLSSEFQVRKFSILIFFFFVNSKILLIHIALLGSLVCCSPWDCKELDTAEQLNKNNSIIMGKNTGMGECSPIHKSKLCLNY